MNARNLFGLLAIVCSVALAAPSFAQQNGSAKPGVAPDATANVPTGPGPSQMAPEYRNDQHVATGTMGHAGWRHHPARRFGMARAHYGIDVAPGAGHYTRRDVAAEPANRMSHPGVGSPKAPSAVTGNRSEAAMNRIENRITARLNRHQAARAARFAQVETQNEEASLPPGE
jgi:hypothetical protein